MISNENCREIAEALRDLVDSYLPHDPDDDDVLKALGIEGGDYPGTSDRCGVIHLADLIDRPTCVREQGSYKAICSNCKVECIDLGDRYCPRCGAEVIKNA